MEPQLPPNVRTFDSLGRAAFSFCVVLEPPAPEKPAAEDKPAEPAKPGKYMLADKSAGSLEEAVWFSFYVEPTARERQAIQRGLYDLAGGMAPYLQLMRERDRVTATIRQQVDQTAKERALDKEDPEVFQAIWEQFADTYEMMLLTEIGRNVDSMTFGAAWPVMGIDLPDGWRNIADKPLSDRLYSLLWTQHDAALTISRAEVEAGKGRSSAS